MNVDNKAPLLTEETNKNFKIKNKILKKLHFAEHTIQGRLTMKLILPVFGSNHIAGVLGRARIPGTGFLLCQVRRHLSADQVQWAEASTISKATARITFTVLLLHTKKRKKVRRERPKPHITDFEDRSARLHAHGPLPLVESVVCKCSAALNTFKHFQTGSAKRHKRECQRHSSTV